MMSLCHKMARAACARRKYRDVEDVAQELALHAWLYFDGRRGRLLPFLFVIARRIVAEWTRHAPFHALDDEESEHGSLYRDALDGEAIELLVDTARIKRLVLLLPKHERDAFLAVRGERSLLAKQRRVAPSTVTRAAARAERFLEAAMGIVTPSR